MPYIQQDHRAWVDGAIEELLDKIVYQAGDLNYVISRIIAGVTGDSYKDINTAIGVLECAKLELYRRLAVPYEKKKIAENGDIPEYTENKNAHATPTDQDEVAPEDGPGTPGPEAAR